MLNLSSHSLGFPECSTLHIGSLIPVDVTEHAYSSGSYDLFITCSFT